MRRHAVILALAAVLLVSGAGASTHAADKSAADRGAAAQPLRVRVVTAVANLDVPWDVAFLPNREMLVTERDRQRVLLHAKDGRVRVLAEKPRNMWSSGETGLMSVVVDPGFRRNRRFYTCHGATTSTGHDIRVAAWRMNKPHTSAYRLRPVVAGLPTTGGRHGGCRLRISPDGVLWIGTGDAASGTPQRLRSLGGKVLRVNRFTGRGARGNPFPNAANANRRRIFTYGHRNVQGLALQRGVGMWSVEHGTYRDDEVNFLVKGGNYGWAPGRSYDESRPMTDFSLPGPQRGAKWRSGDPTFATSGAVWLTPKRWGPWRGRLAVASLKDKSIRIIDFDSAKRVVSVLRPAALTRFGRLRSLTLGPSGALNVTTSNGQGGDRVIRVLPVR